jgi:histone H1/5
MSTAAKKSYFELAKEAIAALKERTGSSAQAIKAHIVANHPTIKFAQHLLRAALNKGSETGKFVKVKASFKLAADEKKKPAVKKAAPPADKKVSAPKAAAKKATTAKKCKICSVLHYERLHLTVSTIKIKRPILHIFYSCRSCKEGRHTN